MLTAVKGKDLTFKYNRNLGRHGWLRLTPAYSVKLVRDRLATIPPESIVFDPFSGTATTGLVAAEHGNKAYTTDINPFLVWFGQAKCKSYEPEYLSALRGRANEAVGTVGRRLKLENWVPPIHKIERWWSADTLRGLAALRAALVEDFGEPTTATCDPLVWIAFCRLVIDTSSAAFNHVSMSFQEAASDYESDHVCTLFLSILDEILISCEQPIPGDAHVLLADARSVPDLGNGIDRVITSPPYPNRISYIRELRPYMYWTKFLDQAREAGELDWKAVGGTWGIATSRLADWKSDHPDLPASFFTTYKSIADVAEKNAPLLAVYVLKYFHDMHLHFSSLRDRLNDGASLNYIVGNSTFFKQHVDTAALMTDSLNMLGYDNVKATIIRKRNSNKALFEYDISATWSRG